ncbi:chorismate mutase [Thioclava sp. SK-1]|uniref:chorismate mutase n=1 Tax=Thioclava sp. SK-1 TaxID=1889770 RepID=UPI0008261BE4|nr:chorismate mutase [Thioclava sp. SK-1]OCX65894.1 chorismate mutase [Thioclava sp. SK-1]
MTDPNDIHSMTDLRSQIDRLDRQIVDLLAFRMRHIDRAAQLKPAEGLPARINARVEDVVAKVLAHAQKAGADIALTERMYRDMIETSILREEVVLGKGDPL